MTSIVHPLQLCPSPCCSSRMTFMAYVRAAASSGSSVPSGSSCLSELRTAKSRAAYGSALLGQNHGRGAKRSDAQPRLLAARSKRPLHTELRSPVLRGWLCNGIDPHGKAGRLSETRGGLVNLASRASRRRALRTLTPLSIRSSPQCPRGGPCSFAG